MQHVVVSQVEDPLLIGRYVLQRQKSETQVPWPMRKGSMMGAKHMFLDSPPIGSVTEGL